MKKSFSNRGISVVEIIIGASIIAVTFVITIGVYSSLLKLSGEALPRIQSAMIADEGVQALRSLRDVSYSSNIASLTLDTPYYLVWSQASSTFLATTIPTVIDDTFYRTFTLSNMYRDSDQNIVSSGTLDAGGRLATINVSFQKRNGTSTQVLQTYILNTFNN